MDSVIALDQVGKHFGATRAVEGIDLSVGRGEFFALLGPSGCGKSTTLRMIAGFERPSQGTIRLEGVDVTATPPHRRNVNTVFQHYALFPHLSVWDNVAFGPRSRRLAEPEVRRQVGEILERVRLSELAARRPGQLSGGQQQRAALARALVNQPAALLLDEPLSALDPGLRSTLQEELKRIQRECGISFLIVTHDQEEALALSDRLAVMNAGRIEQIGPPRQVYDAPSSSFVARFIGRANLLAGGDGRSQLLLRPEQLRLQADPLPSDPAEQAVRARVTAVTFQGPSLLVELDAADGSPLVVRLNRWDAMASVRSGESLWVVWQTAAAHRLTV
ncbi:ABC transporter ATP-binding protein [Synechococcus sp. CS-1325]|uniref:ABC transporter ATP-binding protein n=1 Tax=Synechococcus sp. CS-1325 TaxID=2847979 RepID=UPI0037D9BBC8